MIREISSDFREYKAWLSNWLFCRRHAFKMSLAIRLADMKQKAFNKRYFIMLMETSHGDKLVSFNNNEFDSMKRKKWLPRTMSYLDLEKEAFYQTDLNRNNILSREERKKAREKYTHYAKKYMK